MTKQRDTQPEAASDPELEVRPEVIEDLDVTGDDAGNIGGGSGGGPMSVGHACCTAV